MTWNDGAVFDGATVCGSTNVDVSFRTPPLTITAWLTPSARGDEASNDYALTPFPPDAVSGDVPGAGGYALGLDVWTDGGSGHAAAVETGANAAIAFHSETGSFAGGERHFVALVIDTGGAQIWTDGALAWQVTDDVPPNESPAPLHLGCHNDDAGYGTKRFYKGRMRDARIYKRTLDGGAIAQLFANGPV
ncbi:MAG TPA: LamG-like jellyroll fold domain-containing protein [Polyangiaceae bacterium]